MVILGSSVFEREDGAAIHQSVKKMCESLNTPEGWNPFNIMHKSASTVGALDLGYKTGIDHIKGRKPDVIINLGADEGLITRDDVFIFLNYVFNDFLGFFFRKGHLHRTQWRCRRIKRRCDSSSCCIH